MSDSRSMTPDVIFLSGDLMFASKVRVAVDATGGRMRMGGQLPDDDLSGVTHVVLDLSTRSKMAGVLVSQCDERCPQAKVIAYGPHVMVDRLNAAREGGIETVLTNGQFATNLTQILSSSPSVPRK